jgi:hypothetical protein
MLKPRSASTEATRRGAPTGNGSTAAMCRLAAPPAARSFRSSGRNCPGTGRSARRNPAPAVSCTGGASTLLVRSRTNVTAKPALHAEKAFGQCAGFQPQERTNER